MDTSTNIKWEIFMDDVLYGMWAVRPVGDKDFNSPRLFHFVKEQDAKQFKELAEKAHIAVPNK
jgi:hypothetical protein